MRESGGNRAYVKTKPSSLFHIASFVQFAVALRFITKRLEQASVR